MFVAGSHRLDFSSGQQQKLLPVLQAEYNAGTMQRLINVGKLFKGGRDFIFFHPRVHGLIPERKMLEHLYLRYAVSIAQHLEERSQVDGNGRTDYVPISDVLQHPGSFFRSKPLTGTSDWSRLLSR